MDKEKRPREYAAAIFELRTRQERMTALNEVPKHLQALTRQHVVNAFALAKSRAKR